MLLASEVIELMLVPFESPFLRYMLTQRGGALVDRDLQLEGKHNLSSMSFHKGLSLPAAAELPTFTRPARIADNILSGLSPNTVRDEY